MRVPTQSSITSGRPPRLNQRWTGKAAGAARRTIAPLGVTTRKTAAHPLSSQRPHLQRQRCHAVHPVKCTTCNSDTGATSTPITAKSSNNSGSSNNTSNRRRVALEEWHGWEANQVEEFASRVWQRQPLLVRSALSEQQRSSLRTAVSRERMLQLATQSDAISRIVTAPGM